MLEIYWKCKYLSFPSLENDTSPLTNRTSQYVADEKGAKNTNINALSSKGTMGKMIPNKAEIKKVVKLTIKTNFIPKRLSNNFIIAPF